MQQLAATLWLLWTLTCSAHLPSRTDYGYDPIGQLKAATPRDASGNVISSQRTGYGYDGAGNLSTRTNDLAVRSFTTDKLNQLTNLGFATLLTVSGTTTTNATNVTVNGITATLNADGTYTATVPTGNGTNTLTAIGLERYGRQATSLVSVASLALHYDANGNLLFDGKKGLAYDDENQLTALVATNSWKTEWTYDGFGRRRIRKEYTWTGSAWLKTNETRYLFDGLLVLQERDSNNAVKVTYTRGLDLSGGMQGAGGIGGLLARTQNGVTNPHAIYHADGNGNVTMLIDAAQTSVAAYSYDPFGNPLSASGSLAGMNEMQFSSKPSYRNATLFEARPYLPSLSRFAQADPIGMAGGFNLHQFVGNDPVNFFDADGLAGSSSSRPGLRTGNRGGRGPGAGGRSSGRRGDGRSIEFEERLLEDVARNARRRQLQEEGLDPNAAYWQAPQAPPVPLSPAQISQQARVLPPCSQGQTFGAGRAGKQDRLRDVLNDLSAASADRGWIRNELRQIEQGNRDTIRNPPGKDLAHERGREAAKGYSYEHSNLQDRDLHRLQHKFDDFGRANKDRPLE